MSDFKFACPACGQRIAATDDYAGYQINCPACQAAIVVPANPAAPPAPPAAARLGVSALGSAAAHASAPVPNAEQQGSAAYQAHLARKPRKSYAGLIAGMTAVAVIGLSAYLGKDWLAGKWKAFHGASAAEIAATNQPPPAPAELTAAEIWQNVIASYKGLTSLSATGRGEFVWDAAQSSPAANTPGTRGETFNDVAIKLGRPDNFRVDLIQHMGPITMSNIAWSTGQGYYRMINNKRSNESSRDAVLAGFAASGPSWMGFLFFNDAGVVLDDVANLAKTNGAAIPGQPCYVLAVKNLSDNTLIWVNKQTFLIQRVQMRLGGNTSAPEMDDAKIKAALTAAKKGQAVTAADITQFKAQMKMASQIKGTITETYQDIQTNVPIALAEFEPPSTAAPRAGQPPGAGPRPGAGPGGGGAPTGRASRIAAGARRRN
ncbi:MAG: hypothetical protein ABSC18_15050 [Verrucomicrobiota bacterium]|jgi:hypothetical protein